MASSHVYWQSSSCPLPVLRVPIHLNLKGNGMKISVPTARSASLLLTKFPAHVKCKLLGFLVSTLQEGHRGWWPGRTLRRKLLWICPRCTRVCTYEPKYREKASSYPGKNSPTQQITTGDATLILLFSSSALWWEQLHFHIEIQKYTYKEINQRQVPF